MADIRQLKIDPKTIKFPPSGNTFRVFFIIALVLLFIITQVLIYIGPNEFAIKEVKLGTNRGIHRDVYTPGWVIQIPGMTRFHKLPSQVQVFDMSNSPQERETFGRRSEKAAHIQTSDGFYVDVDASILYRIEDPYKLVTTVGPGELYIDNGIIPRAEPVMKQALGTLTTEEFYNSHLRTARAEQAHKMLDAELDNKGLKIEQVLIRYFAYSPEIQKNIEAKKLKDQQVFKNQSEKKAASQEAVLKRVVQEGEAEVSVKLQEGEAYIVTKRAEQELYARKKRAEGDLQVKLAEAYKTELRNEALQAAGSDNMVGLKMAEVLDGLRVVILPSDGAAGMNPIDLEKNLRLFGVKK